MVKTEPIYFRGKDERGVTGEIDTYGRSGKFILASRKAGSISGNHYHKGLEPGKNPEIVYFLKGKSKISFASIDDSGNRGNIQIIEAIAPCQIEVSPWCWHQFLFTEDSVFLELNSFDDGDRDTFKLA